jgi:ABC-2 type transport system permease protein
MRKRSHTRKLWWIPVLLVLIFINILASRVHTRVDLTAEKRFTLSSSVKRLIKKVDSPVVITVFLKGNLPAAFKGIASYTDDLLSEFRDAGGGNITYRFINPEEQIEGTDRTYADTLKSLQVTPINLKVQLKAGEQSQYVFPVALVNYNGKTEVVTLYEGNRPNLSYTEYYKDVNSAEAMMEYKFARAISSLTMRIKPLVAYSFGNGEPRGGSVWDLAENILRKNNSLFMIDINKEPIIPDTFKLLVIAKPTIPFSEREKLKIDQYILHGGKVLWFIDKLNAEMDSLRIKNQVIAFDRNLNLDDLLFHYGVRINSDLVMDLQCDYLPFDISGNKQFEFLHWNYFPLFESSSNHPINRNLGLVEGKFVNSIDTVKSTDVTKITLLSSSSNSRIISTPALISGQENRNAPQDEQFTKQHIPVAVLMEGRFTSLYANRIGREQTDSLEKYGTSFLGKNIQDNKMIVVADGDIALNGATQQQPLPMGVNPYTIGSQYQYQFANHEFVENCVEYLINNNNLSEAKAKDYTLRLLDPKRVEEEKGMWQAVNLGFPIIIVAIFGFIYQYVRKRKYTRQ